MKEYFNIDIYNNFRNDGIYTVEYKKKLLQLNLPTFYKAAGLSGESFGKLVGVSKQAISNFCNGKTQKDFTNYFVYSAILCDILKNKYQDKINIEKINDILFCNTDKYDDSKIQAAISILTLLRSKNAFKIYNNALKAIQTIIEK